MEFDSEKCLDNERHVLVLDEVSGIEIAFRRIAVGEFTMGSRGYEVDEEPRHRVTISEDFWMAETPVTQAQFAVWTGSDDYAQWFAENAEKLDEGAKPHASEFDGDPQLPAVSLSWYEALGFCGWLNTRLALRDEHAALPTEAQWEYACRGGPLNLQTEYWNGDGEAALDEIGWFAGNADSRSHPVATRGPANPCGLFDLHGNVWEWCRDRFAEDIYPRRVDGVIDPLVRKEDVLAAASGAEVFERRAKMFAQIADEPDEISGDNLQALESFLPLARANAVGNNSWKQVVTAVEETLPFGPWPTEQVGLAQQLSKMHADAAKGLANPEDPPRVLRGGSWRYSARDCRSACRNWFRAGNRDWNNGFRVGLFPGPVKSQ